MKNGKFMMKSFNFYKEQDAVEARIFWGIVPLSLLIMGLSVITAFLEGMGAVSVMTTAASFLLLLVLAWICSRQGEVCIKFYKYFLLLMNLIIMPGLFLTNGGMASGMPIYCLCSFILCAFCVSKKDRHKTGMLSFIWYAILFAASIRFPAIVIPLKSSLLRMDVCLSLAVAAVYLTVLISKAMNEINRQRFHEVNNGLVNSLGTIIEFRSLETGNHVNNMKAYTRILLETADEILPGVDFSKQEIEMISSAAVLHDMGKIAVPDSILQKQDRLTREEYEIMKHHPIDGCHMIETMREYQDSTYFSYCYEICRHHHERFDGKGYPDGLSGNEIPLISQIAALADVYDALTSVRVYKPACSPEDAFDIMAHRSEGQFSRQMIQVLEAARPRLEIQARKSRLSDGLA